MNFTINFVNKDIKTVCRTCLNEEKFMFSIFDNVYDHHMKISELIMKYCTVEIKEGDGLPGQICLTCMNDAKKAFCFKNQCERAEVILKSSVVEIPSDIEIKSEIKDEDALKLENHNLINDPNQPKGEYSNTHEKNSDFLKKEEHYYDDGDNDDIEILSDTSSYAKKSKKPLRSLKLKKNKKLKGISKRKSAKKEAKTKSKVRTKKQSTKLKKDPSISDNGTVLPGPGTLKPKRRAAQPKGKSISCNLCSYQCARLDYLKLHQRVHTGERPYLCHSCHHSSPSSSALNKHIRSKHTDEKKFSCEQCGYRAKFKGALITHMQIHSSKKRFSCTSCPYETNYLVSLENHKKEVHSGERPFACDKCSYRTINAHRLKAHMRIHCTIRLFPCDVCNFSAYSQARLNYHKRTHTGEKPYTCHLCNFKTADSSSLRRHLRRIHHLQ